MILPISRPEWLPRAISQTEKTIRLYRKDLIPETILGWMLVVDCMHILRCVYGDDLSTAIAIRKKVLEDETRSASAERKAVPHV